MGFFDLIEQDHPVWAAAHSLGQLTTFFVANITGRGAEQARDGMLLPVFAHIDAHQGLLIIEHKPGQRLSQLGLTHTRRTDKDEGSNRPAGIV